MTSATDLFQSSCSSSIEVDVWLEAGREGRCFTYIDSRPFGVGLGDLVLVRLRGRLMKGLVVAKRASSPSNLLSKKSFKDKADRLYKPIEGLIQSAAVDPLWREWLESRAACCYTSQFRMLKAALPPGWLGQSSGSQLLPLKYFWIQLELGFDKSVGLPRRQLDLRNTLLQRGGGAWQKDLASEGYSLGLVNSLIRKGLVSREKRELKEEECLEGVVKFKKSLEPAQELNSEQAKAVEIYKSQSAGEAMLLWGVTGSGKTEVYLQLAERELVAGNHCLILTPEIGLIPQLVDRFRKRFGPVVWEYHSACSEKERVSTWRKGLNAEDPIVVVGTRSAVFLPLVPLGLIVVDEEHDSSYKQESPMPCYHARDLALDRAQRVGAKVVMGTATPSLVTWKNLAPRGQIALARLNNRIENRPLPTVHLIDMRQELAEGHRLLVSRALISRLAELPEKKEQAVILVPRRGYSSFLSCRSCGEVVQCPHCDIALTVHKKKDGFQWLRCHWCDYRSNICSTCSFCGSSAFKPFGAGTQRVMEHLAQELEGVTFLRFDRDSIRGRDGHRQILERFANGEADVLVGTQMLSKGMDLPKVTLAAVLAADGLLHRPDLQASEQALQTLMQLAGRAGRGENPGKVFVQTYCPDHPVIRHLVDGQYEEFLEKESILRKSAGLIPYSRACLLRLAGESASLTATAAATIAELIRPMSESLGWTLIGPAPSMVARVAGRSRWQLLLHGPEESSLPLPTGTQLWDALPKGVTLAVDPDPIHL
ncbi:primosomal protein N' [Prochlorococcus sp. MIT 1341]|uniref:replication restart helicase PriA n=1 Tax=Prochlorococcus sp. MIT 1341 TaxID=3096221 RepID=UPI002A7503E8|nr:primosomal protein N' [Prochlorococcus sp. MIT 1341]